MRARFLRVAMGGLGVMACMSTALAISPAQKIDPDTLTGVREAVIGETAEVIIDVPKAQAWFSVTVEETGYLRLGFDRSRAPDLEVQGAIYDVDGRLLGIDEALVGPKRVIVLVREMHQNEAAPDPVLVNFMFTPQHDFSEPANDTRGGGRRITPGGSATLSLIPLRDRDWFVVAIDQPGYLRLVIDEGEAHELEVEARIFNSGGDLIGVNEARVTPGDVHVMIRETHDNESSSAPMEATFRFWSETDRHEPNDRLEDATALSLGEPFPMALMPLGDRDWLRVEVPQAGYLRLVTSRLPEGADLRPTSRFHDRDGRVIGEEGAVRVSGPGPVLVEVGESHDNASSPLPFEAELAFVPEFDLLEPNDSPSLAARLGLNEWTRAGLAPAGDLDHYRITVAEPGWLAVETIAAPKAQWMRGALFDAAGRQALARGLVVPVEPGEYVYRLWSDAPSLELAGFELRLRFVPTLNEELDRPGEVAGTLAVREAPYEAALYPAGDVERWEFEAAEPGYLALLFERVPTGVRPRLRVLQGERVLYTGLPAPVRLEPGKYLLEFFDARDWSSVSETFRFLVRFEPDFDSHEPNDKADAAKPLTLGEATRMAIYGGGDVDWFTFGVTEPGLLRLWLKDVGVFEEHKQIGLDVTLLKLAQEAGPQQVHDFAPSGRSSAPVTEVQPGDYLLRIAARGGGFAREPFWLTLEHVPVGAPTRAPGGLVTALVGLELSEKGQATYRQVADMTGALTLQAEQVDRLESAMRAAVVEAVAVASSADAVAVPVAEEARRRGWAWSAGGAGAAALLITAVVMVYRGPRRRAA